MTAARAWLHPSTRAMRRDSEEVATVTKVAKKAVVATDVAGMRGSRTILIGPDRRQEQRMACVWRRPGPYQSTSPLDQIDRSNVHKLQIAWRWQSVDEDIKKTQPKAQDPKDRTFPHVSERGHAADDRRCALHLHVVWPDRRDRCSHRKNALELRSGALQRRTSAGSRVSDPRARLLDRRQGATAFLHRRPRLSPVDRSEDGQAGSGVWPEWTRRSEGRSRAEVRAKALHRELRAAGDARRRHCRIGNAGERNRKSTCPRVTSGASMSVPAN